ncbi:UDP-glycosyltransferase 73B4-like [Neltuma alba]|uniref:UDP-glycosyltransferase 73B4-like n=1 Tax=Neltuma alba TaxID=207710 RepID=UPI0010A2C8FF|nr:UDP-glycosyltransferase 73B4-like [Prosopis alba]XP_028783088.1 UDP-glycosyltransferase 73B4-like [Prosopis alba]
MDLSSARPLKVYVVPYPGPGHMVPLCELGRFFANRGQLVTIITTPSNVGKSFHSTPHSHLRFQTFDFPSQEVGLPQGVENFVAVSDGAGAAKIHMALRLLRQPIEEFIEKNPPDCIVADFFFPWTTDLAQKLGIPRLVFFPYCAFAACMIKSTGELLQDDDFKKTLKSDSDPFIVPGLPHPITMTMSQLPNPAKLPKGVDEFGKVMKEAELKSHGIVVNSFAEIDVEYTQLYEKFTGKKLWPIGPPSLIHRSTEEKTQRSHKSVVGEQECLSFLNSKKPNSVVYIAFGSAWSFPDNQLYEIARGIESSGHNFILVVFGKREDETEEEREKWMPRGFEEKMKSENKGMIIRGWAPQLLILGHPAVGGFMTHCGWNSVLESVSAGVPMITWPLYFDHFYNEKLVTQVHGCGAVVGCEEYGLTAYEPKEKLVTQDMIEKAVRKVMDGGEEAAKMRSRIKELSEKAKKAVEEGGSSHNNLTVLIEELQRFRQSEATKDTGGVLQN